MKIQKVTLKTGLLLISLVSMTTACDGMDATFDTLDASVEETAEELPATYNTERSNLVLPNDDSATIFQNADTKSLETNALFRRVLQLQNESNADVVKKPESNGVYETEFYSMNVHQEEGFVDVLLKADKLHLINRAERRQSHDETLAFAKEFFEDLGIDDAEAETDVRSLMTSTRNMQKPDEAEEIAEAGQFVFINRKVNGIPVAGDRITMYVKPDGLLYQIQGKWTPISFAQSQLQTKKSKKEILGAAALKLVDSNKAENIADFTVSTYYAVEKNAEGANILRLKSGVEAFGVDKTQPLTSFSMDL